ncbi:hypothetical protein P0136_08695 [Lentisphaerota bacterium ZTH]|nr:hypothetical protein JYG24_00200 [Lentisphaerota bacterium]WET05441.1 hypothetical protein P0136_08695 [Lentisphaerota bacterium ZTH]
MKKLLLFLLVLLSFSIVPQVSGLQRLDDAWDTASTSFILGEDNSITVFAPQWTLWPIWNLTTSNGEYRLIGEMPAIGVYKREGYDFRQKLLIINLNESALELLPRHMRQAIIPGIKQFDNMGEEIVKNNLKCHICAVITGKGSHTDDVTMVGKEFNLSFHGFIGRHFQPNLADFAADIPVGMFVPKGVLAASHDTIPMERCGAIHVSCHRDGPNKCLSPDNARFTAISEISSFWTVAKNGGPGDDIIITYHLLLNTARISDAAYWAVNYDYDYDLIPAAAKYDLMLAAVRRIPNELNLDEFSASVLKDWVDNVVHVSREFNPEEPFSPTEEPPKLAHENYHGFNVVEYRGKFYGIQQDQGAFYMSKIENGDYNVSFDGNSLEAVQARITDYVTPKLDFENYHAFNIIEYMGGFYGILQNEGAFDINRIMNGGYSASFAGNSQAQVRERIDDHLN